MSSPKDVKPPLARRGNLTFPTLRRRHRGRPHDASTRAQTRRRGYRGGRRGRAVGGSPAASNGGLLAVRTIKNGLKMLSQQNSPEMALKPTTIAPVSETRLSAGLVRGVKSLPASPSVENASEESAERSPPPRCRCQSRLLGPPGSLTGSPCSSRRWKRPRRRSSSRARRRHLPSFAGKDLEDGAADDDDDSDSESPGRPRCRAPGARERTDDSRGFLHGHRPNRWVPSPSRRLPSERRLTRKTIYFDDESLGGNRVGEQADETGLPKTVIKNRRPSPSARRRFRGRSPTRTTEDRVPSRLPQPSATRPWTRCSTAPDKDLDKPMSNSLATI